MEIIKLKDGTEKYWNPFVGLEVWHTPGRKHRPGREHYHFQLEQHSFEYHEPQDYCDFCPHHYLKTTPEKERVVLDEGRYKKQSWLAAPDIFANAAEFRRIANLYEIMSFNYWKENYPYKLSAKTLARKDAYLSSVVGKEHVTSLIDAKLNKFGYAANDVAALPEKTKLQMADFLFGGSHELIIPAKHYIRDAQHAHQVCAACDLTPEEHLWYYQLTLSAVQDIYQENPFVRFVNVYTNWLRDAGATFEHLHRQVIGLDRVSVFVERMVQEKLKQHDIFQHYCANMLHKYDLTIAENEHAVAFADMGHPYTTIAIYVKGEPLLPYEYESKALENISNLVHALHKAFGRYEATNEEWYYTPPHSTAKIPWSILLKWRKNRHAGLEGSTGYYFDVFRPVDVKELFVEKLLNARKKNEIAENILIGSNCLGEF